MKVVIFVILAGFISAVTFPNKAFAQASNEVAIKKPNTKTRDLQSAKISQFNDMSTGTVDASHLKALNDFNKNYNVTGEEWSKGKDCFLATYVENNKTNRVYYDTKGRWQGTQSTYDESMLPSDIREMLITGYPAYKTIVVNEINTPGSVNNPAYLIIVEGAKDYKYISIVNGDMQQYKELKKVSYVKR